jgi:chromosome partitioning protein
MAAKIIAACNAKGGTGKTTVVINLAATLAIQHSKRVLAIDLDSQGNLGIGFGLDPRQIDLTTYHLLNAPKAHIEEYVQQVRPKIDLIPNAINTRLENAIDVLPNRDSLLKRKLRLVQDDYDYVIIDTPPAMRTPTMNAIVVADEILVIVDCGYFALYGLTDLMTQIADAQTAHDKENLVIRGLLNLYNKGQVLDNEIHDQVVNFFGPLMLSTVIHKNVRLAEATSHHQPIIEYDRTAHGTLDFLKLTKELLDEHQDDQDEAAQTRTHARRNH